MGRRYVVVMFPEDSATSDLVIVGPFRSWDAAKAKADRLGRKFPDHVMSDVLELTPNYGPAIVSALAAFDIEPI